MDIKTMLSEENCTTEDLYVEVCKAIKAILSAGQAYTSLDYALTRANLKDLYALKSSLWDEISSANAADANPDLIFGCSVATFDRR